MPHAAPNTPLRPYRRRLRVNGPRLLLGVGVLLLVCVPVACYILQPDAKRAARRHVRKARVLIETNVPEQRKRGAWFIAEKRSAAAADLLIVPRLEPSGEREQDPDVRESYVYALGRTDDPRFFDLLADLATALEEDGYVRAAAWLAAARVDERRFRTLIAERAAPVAAWDRIGVAQARLAIGDCAGVDVLLHYARVGDHDRHLVCVRALHKGVLPVLDAVGRWPVHAGVVEGDPWPAELVDAVTRACAEVDLQEIADDSRQHVQNARQVRRNLRRVTGARERIASLLFWGD